MELEQAKTEVKELREKLEYYAKLYADGLLDPDFLTCNN